jgi:sec-independent protein translocase protein TatA
MKVQLLFLEGLGMSEILIIGLFMLVFFGAKRLPEFMKGLGKGVNEFKKSMRDVQNSMDSEDVPQRKPVSRTPEVRKPESTPTEAVATPETGSSEVK